MFSAKQFVEGCGRETQIVRLADNGSTYYPKEKVELLEVYFQRYVGGDRSALSNALGLSDDDAETQESFYGYFRGLRGKVERLERLDLGSAGLGDHRVEQPEWTSHAGVRQSSTKTIPRHSRGLSNV